MSFQAVRRQWKLGISSAKTIGRDMSILMRAMAQQPSRNCLIEQARQSNQVAVSLLKADREIGLMRYYGLSEYWKQKRAASLTPSSNPSDSPSATTASSNSTTDQSDTTAKVAFMITSSMRTELSERLGYDNEMIRKMTPLQASLVLEHSLVPEEHEAKLPKLIEEHERIAAEELAKKQAAAMELMRQQEEEAKRLEQLATSKKPQEGTETQRTESASTPHQGGFSPDYGTSSSSFFTSRNVMHDQKSGSWYQVVEKNIADGSEAVVALYPNLKEAQEGLETHQYFAERRSHDKSDTRSANLRYSITSMTE